MALDKITFEVELAWWFLYLYWPGVKGMLWLARLVNEDVEPNWEKLEYWLRLAVKIKKSK